MRYLVTFINENYFNDVFISEPFLTNYFDPENHFNLELDMVVYDLQNEKHMVDGKSWIETKRDHL